MEAGDSEAEKNLIVRDGLLRAISNEDGGNEKECSLWYCLIIKPSKS